MLERVSFSSVEKEDVKVLLMIELLPVFWRRLYLQTFLKSVFEFHIEFYKWRKVQENSTFLKNKIQNLINWGILRRQFIYINTFKTRISFKFFFVANFE
jgi:hypothetical protein